MMENGATDGDFNFCRLDEAGFTMDSIEQFMWVDIYEDGAWLGGQWYDLEGNPVDKENDYTFSAAEAFWFVAPQAANGETYKFVSSGTVNPLDLSFELRDSGNVIGNPNPVVVKLSTVTISGYEQNETMMENGATDGDFNFCRLDDAGFTMDSIEQFMWVDIYEDGAWLGGCWYDLDGNEVNEENDYDINIGEGLWLVAPQAAEGEVYTIDFPSAL